MTDLATLFSKGGSADFSNYQLYTQGARWGLGSKCTIDLSMEGGERYYERGVYIGSSWGIIHSSVAIDAFVPEGGRTEQQQIIEALSVGNYAFVTAGKIGQQFFQLGFMQVKSCKVESDMAKATCVINAAFEGGSPGFMQSTAALPLRLAI